MSGPACAGRAFSDGFLRKSASGKWVGVLKYRDAAGRWRQVTRTLTRDRAESELGLASWRAEMEGAAARAPISGKTVEEAVRACLSSQLARGRIERSTHDTQLAYAERSLFPELGGLPIAALTAARAQEWVDGLCSRMAPGSARIAYSTLRKACAREAAAGLLGGDPLAAVEPPARTRPSRSYLPDASVALLESALDREWGPADGRACAARLALHAGLRAGECCALRWGDVDPGAGRLRVAASVGRSRGGPYLKGPKGPASERVVPCVSALGAALEARRAACANGPADFVCGEGAAFPDPHSLTCSFARLCGRAGVVDSEGRRATFHELRHTFATRAVLAGVDARTLADMLGHASADVTLNVYAASSSGAMAAAVARMEAALGGPPG